MNATITRAPIIATADAFEAVYAPDIGEAYAKRNYKRFFEAYKSIYGAERFVEILIDCANDRAYDFHNISGFIHDFCKYRDVQYCEGVNEDFLEFLAVIATSGTKMKKRLSASGTAADYMTNATCTATPTTVTGARNARKRRTRTN